MTENNIEISIEKNIESNIEDNIKNKIEYKNLVISGGGFNGYQFFGIIKYLDENNLLDKIDKFIGVSMGSFINLLIIIGYKYNEIEKFLINFDYKKIFDLKLEKILTEENIKGLSNGDNFTKKIYHWKPKKKIIDIVRDTYDWQKKNYKILKNYLN